MAGRVYVITGAFGVLGSAVAKAAAAEGARLALIDFAQMPTDTLPSDATILLQPGVDLTDTVAAGAAIDAAADHFGGIDALLNIAGGFSWEKIEGATGETWKRLFLMNV